MKALFIGGTGTISMAITRLLADNPDWELYLLNRGSRNAELPAGVKVITADIHDEAAAAAALEGMQFDCVCDFIGFVPEHVERDFRLFHGRTKQYIYISSASAYQKPCSDYLITESTPLHNPYWAYSDLKAQCEKAFLQAHREGKLPVTIVRPSHTYCERSLPVQIHGGRGPWVVMKRMLEGKSVPVACDGVSLWTATTAEDFAVYFCGLLGNEKALGEAFHITSDESLTWNQIYQIIADGVGGEFKPCYVSAHTLAASTQYDYRGSLLGDKAHTVIFDNSKVKRMTGIYDHKCTPFSEGAKRSVQYFLEHPEVRREDPAFELFCDQLEVMMQKANNSMK